MEKDHVGLNQKFQLEDYVKSVKKEKPQLILNLKDFVKSVGKKDFPQWKPLEILG